MTDINNLETKKYKVAIIAPVPFYYHVPIYRILANDPGIVLTVYYCSDWASLKEGKIDNPEFLNGYTFKFVKNYSPFSSLMHWPFGLMNFGIWREIKLGRYDAAILHSWNNLTWWLAFFACLRFKIPIFFMTDSNILAEPLKSTWKKKLKKILFRHFLFKKATGFLTSGKANEEFYRYYGVPNKKIVRMPYSWGYEWFIKKAEQLKSKREEIREHFGVGENDFVILFVGRLSREKLLRVLLDAYNQTNLKNKRLFIVGDGPLRQQLEGYVKKTKIEKVHFAGFQPRENLSDFYTMVDVLVLPSENETWGIVVNEAMCFSLPVIVSDRVGSGPDLVKNNYNGFIYPCGDINGLAESIEKLMSMSYQERSLFGKRSLEIITQWIKAIDPVQQILKILKSQNK